VIGVESEPVTDSKKREFEVVDDALPPVAVEDGAIEVGGAELARPGGDVTANLQHIQVLAPGAKRGGMVKVMGHQEVASLSPDDDSPSVQWVMVTQIHNALLEVNEFLVLEKVLAESYSVSNDGLQYTFKLRTGVKWSDGKDFSSADVAFTFNWFYVDSRHIAYLNSGENPVRAPGTNPLFPVWGSFPWQGFDPAHNTALYTPFDEHPQAIDQPYFTSWNNKQAPGYGTSDSGSIYRSQLLDDRLARDTAGPKKMTLAQEIDDMESAGTVDLRGVKALPYALQVIGQPSDPSLRSVVDGLAAWVADGETFTDSHVNLIPTRSGGTHEAGFRSGIFEDLHGKTRITPRESLPEGWFPDTDKTPTIWECVQHTARVLNAKDGGAEAAEDPTRRA